MLQSIVLDYLFGENCVCKIQLFSKKCAKKSGIWLLINQKNALNPANSNMQKKCAGLCIQEKLKLWKFPVKASTQKFLSEIVHSIDWE